MFLTFLDSIRVVSAWFAAGQTGNGPLAVPAPVRPGSASRSPIGSVDIPGVPL